MLSAYLPRGTSLERQVIEEAGPVPESAVWIDLVTPTHAEDKLVEQPARHRGADARGNAGDRGLEPALCRERRALHDRDADVPVGHRDAENHAGHLHPGRPPAGYRALRRAQAVRASSATSLRATCPPTRLRRVRPDGSARRGDRPRRRHSGAHRRRDRPRLARHFRARGAATERHHATATSSRPSAARAT